MYLNRYMKTVGISILGTSLDKRGRKGNRWDRWRPTVSLCQQEDLVLDRLELLFQSRHQGLADQVTEDIRTVSPETEVVHHYLDFEDPWDFEAVYSNLYDFSQQYQFKPEKENYLVHITTGTHVAQICLYLLTETNYLPGKLIQTSPAQRNSQESGQYQIIDLDLSKYDQIASRFQKEHYEGAAYLKSGIETLNPQFNTMIEQLEKVSVRSEDPILLMGPTGAGKTQLAKRIFELKQHRGQVSGPLVVVNCATLRGDNAMSALFGHTKGSYTGATTARAGLLKEAEHGVLFLDEIGELGTDEQAMLLRALEEKRFLPLGADKEIESQFQLIAGTNRNLHAMIEQGKFREDLLARINLWPYHIPSLRERIEDLEPNLEYEVEQFSRKAAYQVGFNSAARKRYLNFAKSPEALWSANFRDLNSSVKRMATLSDGGRISESIVEGEIVRLQASWAIANTTHQNISDVARTLLGERADKLDRYDHIVIAGISEVCHDSKSMADAGRKLFGQSREKKRSVNDSHRLKQILAKYDLDFDDFR